MIGSPIIISIRRRLLALTARFPSTGTLQVTQVFVVILKTSKKQHIISMASASNGESSSNKKAKMGLSMTETVHFDPTSIGLPAGWSLTDWSDLKG